LVDDWTFYDKDKIYYVEKGTRDSIKDLNLKAVYEKTFLSSGIGNDVNAWWNGYYIGLLKK
jgi:hypothetical protein